MLTVALPTPGMAASAASILAAHEAQCIPDMDRMALFILMIV
jgi:hypothetical protein